MKLARKLEKLPLVAEAFAAGEISERHASVIATAATRGADGGVHEPRSRSSWKWRAKCPPKDLATVVQIVTDALDGDGGAGAEDRMFQRRRYKQSRTLDDALAIDGLLDPESAGSTRARCGSPATATNAKPSRGPRRNATPMRSR